MRRLLRALSTMHQYYPCLPCMELCGPLPMLQPCQATFVTPLDGLAIGKLHLSLYRPLLLVQVAYPFLVHLAHYLFFLDFEFQNLDLLLVHVEAPLWPDQDAAGHGSDHSVFPPDRMMPDEVPARQSPLYLLLYVNTPLMLLLYVKSSLEQRMELGMLSGSGATKPLGEF